MRDNTRPFGTTAEGLTRGEYRFSSLREARFGGRSKVERIMLQQWAGAG
jgi:hypothetical protein